MATTTNYGWTTPDDTSLVKDGAAAIRTLGSSVDTTTKALNPSTTLGDIEYRSATANTNTRLGVGSTGQVLTVAAGVPSWATPTSGMTNPLTTTGDTIYSSSGTTPARLGIGTSGQVLTVAAGVPSWATPSSPAFSGAQAYFAATTQSISNATFTVVNFDVESYDTNSYHSNVTNNSRMTIPTTGYYNLTAYISFEGNVNGGRLVQIYKNGATVVQNFQGNYALGSSSDMSFFCSVNVNATAGDYFEIRVRQASGISLGVLGLNSTQYSFFQAQSLGA